MFTEYDWRVGVLNRQPLFVCQYKMAPRHWQVVRHGEGGRVTEGGCKTLAVADAPKDVVETAIKAANLMGDGLYGVDLKQNERGVFVIEVNDNPNIDRGTEDAGAEGRAVSDRASRTSSVASKRAEPGQGCRAVRCTLESPDDEAHRARVRRARAGRPFREGRRTMARQLLCSASHSSPAPARSR